MQPSDQTKMLTKPRVIKKPRFKNFIITTMKVFYENCTISVLPHFNRGVNKGGAGVAIAPPYFGSIEAAAG
jgi:hypothetical protein